VSRRLSPKRFLDFGRFPDRVFMSKTSRTSSARGRCPCLTSQRGLSGIKAAVIRKASAGTPITPNIQRQTDATSAPTSRATR